MSPPSYPVDHECSGLLAPMLLPSRLAASVIESPIAAIEFGNVVPPGLAAIADDDANTSATKAATRARRRTIVPPPSRADLAARVYPKLHKSDTSYVSTFWQLQRPAPLHGMCFHLR